MDSNGSNRNNVFDFLSYIVLVIAALLIFINKLLPLVGLNISGATIHVLETIKEVFILLVIGFSAYNFVAHKRNKAWKVIFIIAMVIFIAGIVLIWFN